MAKFPTNKTTDKTHLIDHELTFNASLIGCFELRDVKLGIEFVENVRFRFRLKEKVLIVEIVRENLDEGYFPC